MIKDFTVIRWAGTDCILVTERETQRVLCLLKEYEVRELIDEWKSSNKEKKQ